MKSNQLPQSSVECQVCGRKLTNPVSIELMIGPVCLCKLRNGSAGIQSHMDNEINREQRNNEK